MKIAKLKKELEKYNENTKVIVQTDDGARFLKYVEYLNDVNIYDDSIQRYRRNISVILLS